jgi:hypothetical protein
MEPRESSIDLADFTEDHIGLALDVHQKNIECLLEEAGTSVQVVAEVRRALAQVRALAMIGVVVGRAGA